MTARLKELRKTLKMTQKDFANVLGIAQTSYCMIETGKNPLSERYIRVICSLYSVNESWLRTGEGEMFFAAPYSKEFAEIFNRLLPETQTYLLHMAKELLRTQEKLLEHSQEQRVASNSPEQLRLDAPDPAKLGDDQQQVADPPGEPAPD